MHPSWKLSISDWPLAAVQLTVITKASEGGRGCAIAWQAKVSGANYHPFLFWDWTDHADDPLGMVSKICSWIPSCFQNFKYRTYWWRTTSKFPKKKLKMDIIALNGYIKWSALIFLKPANKIVSLKDATFFACMLQMRDGFRFRKEVYPLFQMISTNFSRTCKIINLKDATFFACSLQMRDGFTPHAALGRASFLINFILHSHLKSLFTPCLWIAFKPFYSSSFIAPIGDLPC